MEEDLNQYTNIIESKENDKVSKVIMIRHAESIANTRGIYQGQTYDTDLSPLGKKQVKVVTKHLKKYNIKKVISSPLKRTAKTAKSVAKVFKLNVDYNTKIIETSHGVWEGKHKNWINNHYSELYKLWLNNPGEVSFPDGESYMSTVERTLDFLENESFESDTLVVTHDNIIRAAISVISQSDINKIWELEVETVALNIFEVNRINDKNMFRILELNKTDYLGNLRNSTKEHAL